MNKLNFNQKGVAALGAVLIIVILVLAGFVGFRVWTFRDKDTSSTKNSPNVETDTAIRNSGDLQEAESTLNSTDLDKDLDTAELDSALE